MVEPLVMNLGERSYPLSLGEDLSSEVQMEVKRLLESGRRLAVVTDRNVADRQERRIQARFGDAPILIIEPGEKSKSLAELGRIWDFLAAQRIDRGGVVIAMGGGVIGDLAGFAAASYLRGLDFYQFPTTLLAMVDSSVGGKTGINLSAGKNLVGAFHQPKGVFIETDVLATLPQREFAAGMAEVIKTGLLADARLFAELEATPLTPTSPRLASVIRRCCELKARIVEADEREVAKDGGRALLNLGHTFGHAIEQVTGYGVYLHGEAVAIGLCAAARLSQKMGFISWDEVVRVENVISAHALPMKLRAALPLNELMDAMARDKKIRAGGLRFVILKQLGQAETREGVDRSLVAASFTEVGAA